VLATWPQGPEQRPEVDALSVRSRLGIGLARRFVAAFRALSAERKAAVLADLDEEARAAAGDHATWAKRAAAHLRKTRHSGVVAALVACSDADDGSCARRRPTPLTFWDGSADENALIEATLLKLARETATADGGRQMRRGFMRLTALLIILAAAGCQRQATSAPPGPRATGWQVRYNAAQALAHRGSPLVKDPAAWESLLEISTRNKQLRKLHQSRDGREVCDTTAARIPSSARCGVAELHRRHRASTSRTERAIVQ